MRDTGQRVLVKQNAAVQTRDGFGVGNARAAALFGICKAKINQAQKSSITIKLALQKNISIAARYGYLEFT